MSKISRKWAKHKVGPGGMKCPCCGANQKKYFIHRERGFLKNQLRKIVWGNNNEY